MADAAEKPPGWRDTWREPKPRKRGKREKPAEALSLQPNDGWVARARAWLASEVRPGPDDLRDTAINILLDVGTDKDALAGARVNAARTLAELATRGKVGGSDAPLEPAELERRYRELAVRLFGEEAARMLPALSSEPASSSPALGSPPSGAAGLGDGADSGEKTEPEGER